MRTILFLLSVLIPLSLKAQLPPACAGGSPATSCATACINCNFNGYFGSTAGYPSGIVPNFCGTVENAQWMGFISGASNATFIVTPSDCAYGDGLQIALYEDCMGQPIACEQGEMGGGNIPVTLDVQVTPGRNYFLMIDGFAGDLCDFTVSVSPENAVYEPPLGAVGSITGPDKVCPGATMTYQVTPVFGAGAYIWSGPPGAMIDTVPLPVTLVGTGSNQAQITFGNAGGQICVQAANSCNQTPFCTNPFSVSMLDDSYRPAIEADTLAHLTCSGDPLILQAKVQSVSDFSFQWTADSIGHIIAGANSKNLSVDHTGTYTFVVTNAQNGCSSSVDIHVGEPDTPRTADLRLRDITCFEYEDGIIRVLNVQGGLAPYAYALDGSDFTASTEYRYLMPGSHHLQIITSDECMWDTIVTLTEPNELIVELGADTSIHLGNSVQLWRNDLVNEPWRVDTLLITPSYLSNIFCDTCIYQPRNSFRYHVQIVDESGCVAIDDRVVSVDKERFVYIPNAFAPDSPNEGNERFTVFGGEDVEQIAWLRVFDRWGQMVFQQHEFEPNNLALGWDGTAQGEKVDPGVFVWQAAILFVDGEIEKRQGDVTVIR